MSTMTTRVQPSSSSDTRHGSVLAMQNMKGQLCTYLAFVRLPRQALGIRQSTGDP